MQRVPPSSVSRGKSRGFTLIELLVVIAIIAILAAILFPVFAQAREKARQSMCLSNLKQCGLGLMQYVQDYDESYPPSWGYHAPTAAEPDDFIMWENIIMPYVKNGRVVAGGETYGGVFTCPSFPYDAQRNVYGTNPSLMPWAYGDMKAGTNWSGDKFQPATLASVKVPTELGMLFEKGQNGDNVWGFNYITDWVWIWDGGADKLYDYDFTGSAPGGKWGDCATMPRYRHNGTTNVAFADGHVKSLPKGRLNWQKNVWGNKGMNNMDFRGPGNDWYPYDCSVYDHNKEP